MTPADLSAAKADKESTDDLLVRAMRWEEWLLSRAAKRETLRRAGLDAPSRRKTSHSDSERRMRQAFGGLRAPDFGSKKTTTERRIGMKAKAGACMAMFFAILLPFVSNSDTVVWPEVRDVMAKQRWPWNGKVDLAFTIVGNMKDFELSVSANDPDNGTNFVAAASALSGDTGTESGAHHVVWDLDAQGLEFKSSNVVFTVSYVLPNPLYCIIDLSDAGGEAGCPVSYMSTQPTGGFNTAEFKTTKLVLRMIEPGSFISNGRCNVSVTKPFYIGMFEVTQRQYQLVMGTNPSSYSYGGDGRPVEKVSWNDVRGNSSSYNWPGTSEVDPDSFIGRLQAQTGLKFDLPTEAQWEYACRAGTTSDYNNGGSATNDMDKVGQYDGNRFAGGVFQQHTTVGSYAANAWGLYDMHGNVGEWCLDWYGQWTSAMSDPKGAESGTARSMRGGNWFSAAMYCASSYRNSASPSIKSDKIGFRIALGLSEQD